MEASLQEWSNLVVRWVHVIAAIMWIGDSFLFMWMDSHLSQPTKPREGAVVGELWMTHSGGFYEVVKRKYLAPDEMPPTLYWFKWESYTTWISGFLLLVIVYYLGGGAYLVHPGLTSLSVGATIGISLGMLVTGVVLYDLLCRTPLVKNNWLMAAIGLPLIVGVAYVSLRLFSPRAAFLQVGAMLGTIMASNVFFRIIPAQRHMLAATRAGTQVDVSYGLRAKQRSTHNHYLTLPVLFTMLSNHFPSTYGHPQAWAVLALLVVFGVGLKYVMNFRRRTPPLVWAGFGASLAGVVAMTWPAPVAVPAGLQGAPPVAFATVHGIVQARCVTCHAQQPTNPAFPQPPGGVALDTPAAMRQWADRMLVRAVTTRTMPLGNLTGMTDEERAQLGAWVAQGASIEGAVDVASAPPPAAPPSFAGPDDEAAHVYESRCAACHGARGLADTPTAQALDPKPRSFVDPAWQSRVTDDHLRQIVVGGGGAVGLNPLMPPNPDLKDKPAVVDALVRTVRGFAAKE